MNLRDYIYKPKAVILILAAIVFGGIYSILDLPVKMYPKVIKPGFRISFGHENISLPSELYKNYGRTIDEQIQNIKEIEKVTTTFHAKSARIIIDGKWDIDEEEIKNKLESIMAQSKAQGGSSFWYSVNSRSEQSSGNMIVAVGHQNLDSEQLHDMLKTGLKPRIEKLNGVSSAHFWGWSYQEQVLELDRDKLLTYKLSIDQVISKINKAFGGEQLGEIRSVGKRTGVKILFPPSLEKIERLKNLPILSDPKKRVFLKFKDIGRMVKRGASSNSLFRLNGVSASYLSISMTADSDVKKTSAQIIDLITQYKKENPGTSLEVIVDPAVFVMRAVYNLIQNAFIGGGVAFFVILFFLRGLSNTIIISISIPFCIIATFILMKIFGVTINIISLGGMAIGVGMIVDSSIVSLENIFRKLETMEDLGIREKLEVMLKGTKEVAMPIIASVLTSIVVFFPIIFTKSYTRAILGDLAKTVVFTLTCSIFSALVLVPIISFHFMKAKKGKVDRDQKSDWRDRLITGLAKKYQSVLDRIIVSQWRSLGVIASCFVIFCASLFFIPKIRKEIIAIPATTLFDIHLNLPDNDDIQLAQRYADKVEKFLKTRSEITSYATYLWDPTGGYVTARLKDRKLFKPLKEVFDKKFESTPDVRINAQKWTPGSLPLPRKVDLTINLTGATGSQMQEFVKTLLSRSEEMDVNMWSRPWSSSEKGINVKFFEWAEDLARNGNLFQYIRAAGHKGARVRDLIIDGKTTGLSVSFLPHQISHYLNDLRHLPILVENKIIPLKAIGEIQFRENSYVPIRLVDRNPTHTVNINFREKNSKKKKAIRKKLKKEILKLNHPEELAIDFPDTNKEINDSMGSFRMSLGIGLIFVFLIIVSMFNSFRYPVIILITVPLAVIGVVSGLYLMDSTLSLNSMLGTILLSGLVVNNAILLIDFYLKQRSKLAETSRGQVQSLIKEAAGLRLRPILMTTLTSLFGVLPVALAWGESGEILQPLGVSIFFGLLVSTLLTLFVIPCFIRIIDRH